MQDTKCVLIGDEAVGKTSLLISYKINMIPFEYKPTCTLNKDVITVTTGDEHYDLRIFDTPGLKFYDEYRPLSYPKTNIFLVCFSVVSPISFQNAKEKWIPEITRHCRKTPFLLVGTKTDLREDAKTIRKLANNKQKPVLFEQGENLAKEFKAVKYVECSALTREGPKMVFGEAFLLAALKSSKRVKERKCSIL